MVFAPATGTDGERVGAGLQNSAEDSTRRWYKELQEAAARSARSIEELSSPKDAQVGLKKTAAGGTRPLGLIGHPQPVDRYKHDSACLLPDQEAEAGAPESRHHPRQSDLQQLRLPAPGNIR